MISLETARLRIRNFKSSDWKTLLELITQYESSEYAVYDQQWPTSPDEIKGITEWFASGDSFFAICLKDTGRFIGLVSLNPEQKESRREFNIGYIFNCEYHRQGYATEACRVAIDYAFDVLKAVSVITGTAAANRASCRLLEKLGFEKTGESMGSFRTTTDGIPIEFLGNHYAISRYKWLHANAPSIKEHRKT